MLRSIWDIKNSYYHVYNRGVNKQQLFYDDQDRWFFIKVLKKAIDRYRLEINAMHLMGNHYHLIIYSHEANLSRAMQSIGSTYAQYFVKKYKVLKKDGHAFRGRFGKKIIDTESYAETLLSYIHLNAFKDGISSHPLNDKWSSYKFYLTGENHFGILTKGIFEDKFMAFSDDNGRCLGVPQKILDWHPDQYTRGGVILGTRAFARKIYDSEVKRKAPEKFHLQIEKALGLHYTINSSQLIEYIGSLGLDFNLRQSVLIYSLMQWSEMRSIDIEPLVDKTSSAIRNTKYRIAKQIQGKAEPLISIIEDIERFVMLKADAGSLKG